MVPAAILRSMELMIFHWGQLDHFTCFSALIPWVPKMGEHPIFGKLTQIMSSIPYDFFLCAFYIFAILYPYTNIHIYIYIEGQSFPICLKMLFGSIHPNVSLRTLGINPTLPGFKFMTNLSHGSWRCFIHPRQNKNDSSCWWFRNPANQLIW